MTDTPTPKRRGRPPKFDRDPLFDTGVASLGLGTRMKAGFRYRAFALHALKADADTSEKLWPRTCVMEEIGRVAYDHGHDVARVAAATVLREGLSGKQAVTWLRALRRNGGSMPAGDADGLCNALVAALNQYITTHNCPHSERVKAVWKLVELTDELAPDDE